MPYEQILRLPSLGDQLAPEKVILRSYIADLREWKAVITRRLGQVNHSDFLSCVGRAVAICRHEIPSFTPVIRKDEGVPIGREFVAASYGVYEGDEGEVVPETANLPAFQTAFNSAKTMTLSNWPTIKVEWTKRRPKAIFFNATGTAALALAQRMFYAGKETIPSWNWRAHLGLREFIDLAEGSEGKARYIGDLSPQSFGLK